MVVEHKIPLRRRSKGRGCDGRLCRLIDGERGSASFDGLPRRFGSTQGKGATL